MTQTPQNPMKITDGRFTKDSRTRLNRLRGNYIVKEADGWGVAAGSLRLLLLRCRGECVDPARIYFIHRNGELLPFWKRTSEDRSR